MSFENNHRELTESSVKTSNLYIIVVVVVFIALSRVIIDCKYKKNVIVQIL